MSRDLYDTIANQAVIEILTNHVQNNGVKGIQHRLAHALLKDPSQIVSNREFLTVTYLGKSQSLFIVKGTRGRCKEYDWVYDHLEESLRIFTDEGRAWSITLDRDILIKHTVPYMQLKDAIFQHGNIYRPDDIHLAQTLTEAVMAKKIPGFENIAYNERMFSAYLTYDKLPVARARSKGGVQAMCYDTLNINHANIGLYTNEKGGVYLFNNVIGNQHVLIEDEEILTLYQKLINDINRVNYLIKDTIIQACFKEYKLPPELYLMKELEKHEDYVFVSFDIWAIKDAGGYCGMSSANGMIDCGVSYMFNGDTNLRIHTKCFERKSLDTLTQQRVNHLINKL